jgi:hypothetical protein
MHGNPSTNSHKYAFEVLIQDVDLAISDLKKSDEQYLRRSTIRTIGSAIEGIIFHLKKIALSQANTFPDLYSELEKAALREETYSINDNGQVQVRPMLLPTKTSIKLIIKMVDKKKKFLHEKSFNNTGWDELISSIEIRNKITHPKNISDLNITKKDINQALKAFNWTLALALRTGAVISENMEDRIASLKTNAKHLPKRRLA